jgi:hypothetical protein
MNTIGLQILKIKKYLIVQWSFLWIFWMSCLLAKYRGSGFFEQWNQAKAYWVFWNSPYHASIRFTPLECYAMIVNEEFGIE